jgi:hypothetical protein
MVHAAHLRDIFRRTHEIATSNARVDGSTFLGYIIHTYGVTQAITVRRQADESPRAATLGRFLIEVADALANELKAGSRAARDQALRERVARAIGQAKTDQAALRHAVRPVRLFVDKRLAHMDETSLKPEQAGLAVDAIHAALDTTFEVFIRWERWLTSGSTPDLVPVPQYDWEAVFRVPWLVRAPREA